jgi:hypothetical protein
MCSRALGARAARADRNGRVRCREAAVCVGSATTGVPAWLLRCRALQGSSRRGWSRSQPVSGRLRRFSDDRRSCGAAAVPGAAGHEPTEMVAFAAGERPSASVRRRLAYLRGCGVVPGAARLEPTELVAFAAGERPSASVRRRLAYLRGCGVVPGAARLEPTEVVALAVGKRPSASVQRRPAYLRGCCGARARHGSSRRETSGSQPASGRPRRLRTRMRSR